MIIKDDLSNKLIHFVKGSVEEASAVFHSILGQGKLMGGTGDITGGLKCVCFTESPIGKFPSIFSNAEFHYAPLGVMVDKTWLFDKGGRPVIYQPEEEFLKLDDFYKFRHKNYNPLKGIDFTWEREWRIQTNELSLDLGETTLIVPNREWVEMFKMKHTQRIRSNYLVFGSHASSMIKKSPWHFIVLEDLGVSIDWGKS